MYITTYVRTYMYVCMYVCTLYIHILTFETETVNEGVSSGISGVLVSPPRRLRLVEPLLLVPWYIGPASPELAGSLAFQLNTTRAVLTCNISRWNNRTVKLFGNEKYNQKLASLVPPTLQFRAQGLALHFATHFGLISCYMYTNGQ